VTWVAKVVIDWDWGAPGIWKVLSPEELNAPAPSGTWTGWSGELLDLRSRWTALSPELWAELVSWNESGDRFAPGDPDEDGESAEFWSHARPLAERVQDELGQNWEV